MTVIVTLQSDGAMEPCVFNRFDIRLSTQNMQSGMTSTFRKKSIYEHKCIFTFGILADCKGFTHKSESNCRRTLF